MNVALIKPQGFCSGVTRAVQLAKQAKKEHPNKTIYILRNFTLYGLLMITTAGDGAKETQSKLKSMICMLY